jgi:hypothetical protein
MADVISSAAGANSKLWLQSPSQKLFCVCSCAWLDSSMDASINISCYRHTCCVLQALSTCCHPRCLQLYKQDLDLTSGCGQPPAFLARFAHFCLQALLDLLQPTHLCGCSNKTLA